MIELKDGVVHKHIFRNRLLCELKVAKEFNYLTKVLLESNQKSKELSMHRKCGQSVTTDDTGTFKKLLGADLALEEVRVRTQ